MDGYQNYRDFFARNKLKVETTLNFDTLSDIEYYRKTEKRGFYVWLKGVSLEWEELNLYSVRKMTEEKSPEWERIERKSPAERFK